MSIAKGFFTAAAAFIAYKLLAKKKAAGTLNFYPAGVKNIGMDGITPVATIQLSVQNPSSESFNIKAISGNISSNGFLIGNINQYWVQRIAPLSSSIISLNIRLSLISVVGDLITAFQTHNFSQELEFDGYINVDSFLQHVTFKYKVGE